MDVVSLLSPYKRCLSIKLGLKNEDTETNYVFVRKKFDDCPWFIHIGTKNNDVAMPWKVPIFNLVNKKVTAIITLNVFHGCSAVTDIIADEKAIFTFNNNNSHSHASTIVTASSLYIKFLSPQKCPRGVRVIVYPLEVIEDGQ